MRRLFRAIAEIIKRGDTVGFGPDADLPGILERLVVPVQGLLAVADYREMTPLELDAQSVPLIGRHLHARPFLLRPTAIDRVIDRDVVFQGIRAGDIVVVRILRPPEQLACLRGQRWP